jgi:hypothetical protein
MQRLGKGFAALQKGIRDAVWSAKIALSALNTYSAL